MKFRIIEWYELYDMNLDEMWFQKNGVTYYTATLNYREFSEMLTLFIRTDFTPRSCIFLW